MAARTRNDERIDLTLRAVGAEVADLPALAAEWSAMPRLSREARELEWDDLMVRLESVVDAAAAGSLSRGQRKTYLRLLPRLCENVSLAERIGLRVPQKVLQAAPSPERAGSSPSGGATTA